MQRDFFQCISLYRGTTNICQHVSNVEGPADIFSKYDDVGKCPYIVDILAFILLHWQTPYMSLHTGTHISML